MKWLRFQSGISEGLAILTPIVLGTAILIGAAVTSCADCLPFSCGGAFLLLGLWVLILVGLWQWAFMRSQRSSN